jgi:hypothetical protein
LFLENVAGDPTTNLYKRLIDSRTRETDFGAQSVSAGFQEEQGHAATIAFSDVPVSKMNDRDLSDVRGRVLDEFRRIASWKDGSPELVDFNNRLRSRVIETRRGLSKFVNSPPGFGFRGNGDEWEFQLGLLEKLGGLSSIGHHETRHWILSRRRWREIGMSGRSTFPNGNSRALRRGFWLHGRIQTCLVSLRKNVMHALPQRWHASGRSTD